MGQVASAFPTAGGLYHWASILGGRGWGWATAWFNLAGLVTVLAGHQRRHLPVRRSARSGPLLGVDPDAARRRPRWPCRPSCVVAHHRLAGAGQPPRHPRHHACSPTSAATGSWSSRRRSTRRAARLRAAPRLRRGWSTFTNYSGAARRRRLAGRPTASPWLFALGFLLPAYTITGFDASAHTAEETIGAAAQRAARHRALGAGLGRLRLGDAGGRGAGRPRPDAAAARRATAPSLDRGRGAPRRLAIALLVGIARRAVPVRPGDGDLGLAHGLRLRARRRPALLRALCGASAPRYRTPAVAIWTVAVASRRCSPSTRRSTRPSPRSARSSSTSPTCCRRRSASSRTAAPGRAMGPWSWALVPAAGAGRGARLRGC